MKKALLFLGVALAFGLSFINTKNQGDKDFIPEDLSSMMLQANAQTEGCISWPTGFNRGKCTQFPDGSYECMPWPYADRDCM